MTDTLLDLLNAKYPLKGLDAGEFAKMRVAGMQFEISAYKAQGLGHVSVITAKGFFSLMKMETLIIVPEEKDLPIFSYDCVCAMGKCSLYLELYNTLVGTLDASALAEVKKQFANLPDFDPGEHWYDNIKLPQSLFKKTKEKAELDKVSSAYLKAFLNLDAENISDVEQKNKKSSTYVSGLLKNGGPSTNVFMKFLGKDKTTDLFKKVLFGTSLN